MTTQNTMTNTTTVTVATLAVALGTILVWVLTMFGLEIPTGIEGAIVTLITAGITYFAPSIGDRVKGHYEE